MSVEYITHCYKKLDRLNERTNGVDRADCIRVNSKKNKLIRLRKIQSSLICEPVPGSNSRINFVSPKVSLSGSQRVKELREVNDTKLQFLDGWRNTCLQEPIKTFCGRAGGIT